MPTIDVSYKDICGLVGKNIPFKELKEKAVLYAKGELEEQEGDRIKLDIKDTNRPDLWSAEGVAREIAGRYGRPGIPSYSVLKPRIKVVVDSKVKKVRPYTACAVVRGLKITDEVLLQMIQLQEKVSLTFGRNRKEVAIGVYNLKDITPPIRYTTVKPEGIKFRPLGFEEEMTPKRMLELHPKGKEFGHLLENEREYPIFMDSKNNVLSMPPIINSDYTGRVSTGTKDVFMECSGFEYRFLDPAINVIAAALADRGGKVEAVSVIYPDKNRITPNLAQKKTKLELDYLNSLSGLNLSQKQACKLLEMARYKATPKGKSIELLYPSYRQDIMHQRDVVEDAIISYGYNNIEPVMPKIATVGSVGRMGIFLDVVSEVFIGLGFQEIMSYTLTNKDHLFTKMNMDAENVVEIENVISSNWSVFRNSLLPGTLEFLSRNKHVGYPQKIFEAGNTVITDPTRETMTRDVKKLACSISDSVVGYEDTASVLDALLSNIGLKFKLMPYKHPTFIPGRTAKVVAGNRVIGVAGEIHPIVLERWGIEKPVAAFEVDLSQIYALLKPPTTP